MVFRFVTKIDNFLKIMFITLLFLYACTSNQLTNTADSCIIFDEKKINKIFENADICLNLVGILYEKKNNN